MTSTILIFLILSSGMIIQSTNSIRNSRQIFYPNRPMIYIEKATSNQFKNPNSITPPSIEKSKPTTGSHSTSAQPPKFHKPATQQAILLEKPVGVASSLFPPPAGPIPKGPSITNDITSQLGARAFSSSSPILFGIRNRPMMQSASFNRIGGSGPRIRPHGLAVEIITTKNIEEKKLNSMSQMFPTYSQVPQTSFRCSEHQFPGYYGDVETSCQVVHICQSDGRHDSFLCPNGTIFNQQYFVCDWWFNVDCSRTPILYSLNSQLYNS